MANKTFVFVMVLIAMFSFFGIINSVTFFSATERTMGYFVILLMGILLVLIGAKWK